MTNPATHPTPETLERRLRTMLPDQYQGGEDVQPTSMGSAGLKFNTDGSVAWNEIWASFCNLAMAGGPPHKGTLLEPASSAEIHANPGRYRQVVDEICRGITLAAKLEAEPSDTAGWVRVECANPAMAGWLTRASAMENVSVRCVGATIELPAGPAYRLEKGIKNVVTVIAKTCHYWRDHIKPTRQQAIAELLTEMNFEELLLQPAYSDPAAYNMAVLILEATGLATTKHRYAGWLGIDCVTVAAAIRIMRLLVASNMLSRREGTAVFLPLDPAADPQGSRAIETFLRIQSAPCSTLPSSTMGLLTDAT